MRKLLVLLAVFLTFSCEKDPCTEEAKIVYLNKSQEDTIIINEDTCFDTDMAFDGIVRINGDFTLTVLGDAVFESSVFFVGNGNVKASGSIIMGSNAIFLGGGNIEADKGLVISGHALDQRSEETANLGGEIKYCNFYSIHTLDSSLTVILDCEEDVECETLSIGGVDVTEGSAIHLPCDFDYENQTVKTNREGRQYIYVKN
jgi:cytoskeletal protein CcmA (bactofilin family)